MPTKSRRSKQKLAMPEICARALRAHRTRQIEERLAAGTRWVETGLIFTTPDRRGAARQARPRRIVPSGLRARRDPVLHARAPARGPVDERGLRFYDLRQSCASLLIAQGVPLRIVQEVLRHTNIRTTADRYTHLVPHTTAEAVAAMDRAFLEAEAAR